MNILLRKASFFVALGVFAAIPAVSAKAQATTSTTTVQAVNNQSTTDDAPPTIITFTPIHKGVGPTPQATFGCSVPPPSVTDTFSTRTATWSGSISCSVAVGLYGTTILFNNNTQAVLVGGSQINTTAASASSSGSYSGLPSGTYQVNFNIDITPPAGYTTSVGGACSYIGSGPRVHCTVGSGAFTQP